MIRCLLAPHVPACAQGLGLPRTLGELGAAAALLASGPGATAVTFDDGPHPEGTPKMLEILAEHQAKATFFLVGEQVARRAELACRILEAGHAIGLHGHRHLPHPVRSATQLAEDFTRAIAAIEDATGTTPRLHRPPYGLYSPASLRIARERGLQPLLWSSWGKDWRRWTTPHRITQRVGRDLRAGAVILLHDADFYSSRGSHQRTAAALPEILATLKSAELDTVTCA